jgi:hypothetical protein
MDIEILVENAQILMLNIYTLPSGALIYDKYLM